MKKIWVSIVPQPVAAPVPPRRETRFQTLRRQWRNVSKPSHAGYFEE